MVFDLSNNDTLRITLYVCAFLYITFTMITNYILRKKGVNIYSTKNTLKIGLVFSPILIWYVWLIPMKTPILDPIITRVILSIFYTALGIVMIYGVRYSGMGYRKYFNIEDEEDKRVRAADEQAKKEKEEKQRAKDYIKYGKQGPPQFLIFLRKNAVLFILEIVIISLIVGIMYSFRYPFNIVFSILLLPAPVLCYLELRHNEKKERSFEHINKT